ncbi:XRE family transcriptional regulator [Vibrio vulnificus]
MTEVSKKVIGERIKQARKNVGLKQKDVAEALDVTPQAVSGWERGVTTPQVDLYDQIATLLDVQKRWLFFDEKTENSNSESEVVEIPFYTSDLTPNGCGCPDFPHSESPTYPLPTKFIKASVDFSKLAMACVCGDAMNPIIPNGSLAAVDTTNKSIVDGRIYLIRVNNFLRVKSLSIELGRIKVKSFNEDYPPEYINTDDLGNNFEIIGKVVWVSSNLN